MQTISSQRYLDPVIVAAKREACDYTAQAVIVELDGVSYRVIVDGHHSMAAAKADGVSPDVEVDTVGELAQDARRDPERFVAQVQMDSEWYDVATGRDVW